MHLDERLHKLQQPLSINTHPQLVLIEVGLEEIDNVEVLAFSEDINFYHEVLKILFRLQSHLFESSQTSILLVFGLQCNKTEILTEETVDFPNNTLKFFNKKYFL